MYKYHFGGLKRIYKVTKKMTKKLLHNITYFNSNIKLLYLHILKTESNETKYIITYWHVDL